MNRKYYVVLLSGGLDSTGLLFRLLEKNKDNSDIYTCAHFVNIPASNNRIKAEIKSTKKIVKYCRENYKLFEFSSSRFSYNWRSRLEGDIIVAAFHGSYVAKDIFWRHYSVYREYPVVEVCQAIDKDEFPENQRDDWKARFEVSKSLFESFFRDHDMSGFPKPILTFPLLNIERKDVITYIPDNIRKYIWSCRQPYEVGDEYLPCGVCKPCILNKKIGVI